MDLVKRFEDSSALAAVSVSSLEPDTPYPITRGKRIKTKYGLAVVLTLQGPDDSVVQVFLPQRYSDVITDTDMTTINSKAIALNLMYKGVCDSSKSYLLATESSP